MMQAHHWEGENDSPAGGPARGTGDAFGTACTGAALFRPRLLPSLQQTVLVAGSLSAPGASATRRIMISGGLGGASGAMQELTLSMAIQYLAHLRQALICRPCSPGDRSNQHQKTLPKTTSDAGAGVGSLVGAWLCSQQHIHVTLLGRSGRAADNTLLRSLCQSANPVTLLRCDVSCREEAAAAVANGLLCGVIHAGGVLMDGVIASQNAAGVRNVFAPKVSTRTPDGRCCGTTPFSARCCCQM